MEKIYELITEDCYEYEENYISLGLYSSFDKAILALLKRVENKKVEILNNIESNIIYDYDKKTIALVSATTLQQLGEEEPYIKYGFTIDKTFHYRKETTYEIIERTID